MATYGPRALSNLVLAPGWDGAELNTFRTEDNIGYGEILAQVTAAIGALNTELAMDNLWAGLVSFTDQPTVEYRQGSANGFEEHTEYGRPDTYRADVTGHMLPIKMFDRRLGWTWDYLRRARGAQIEADVADAIKDARDLWRMRILTRLLKRGDDTGAGWRLGSAGESPGFATASGSTGVPFTPPAFGGTSFTSSHEHYVAIAGGAYTTAVFSDAYDELREHGHEPPFDFLIGPEDRATVEGLTGFVKTADALVSYGTATAVANIPAEYIGTLNYFRVREVRGVPRYWGVGYKSYGLLSQRNPLRVRLEKGKRALEFTLGPDQLTGSPLHPVQNLMLYTEFGVGVGDRTAATPRYVNNSTWADGTPT